MAQGACILVDPGVKYDAAVAQSALRSPLLAPLLGELADRVHDIVMRGWQARHSRLGEWRAGQDFLGGRTDQVRYRGALTGPRRDIVAAKVGRSVGVAATGFAVVLALDVLSGMLGLTSIDRSKVRRLRFAAAMALVSGGSYLLLSLTEVAFNYWYGDEEEPVNRAFADFLVQEECRDAIVRMIRERLSQAFEGTELLQHNYPVMGSVEWSDPLFVLWKGGQEEPRDLGVAKAVPDELEGADDPEAWHSCPHYMHGLSLRYFEGRLLENLVYASVDHGRASFPWWNVGTFGGRTRWEAFRSCLKRALKDVAEQGYREFAAIPRQVRMADADRNAEIEAMAGNFRRMRAPR